LEWSDGARLWKRGGGYGTTLLRCPAMWLRRAVHSGAARSAELIDGAERLDRGSLRVVEPPLRSAFF
jgi:hypothetical protein